MFKTAEKSNLLNSVIRFPFTVADKGKSNSVHEFPSKKSSLEPSFIAALSKFDAVGDVDEEVTVLGTKFNVKERGNYFEVKTFEGLVSVAYKGTLVKLPKGTIFKVINGKINAVNTFDINENSWLQKESNFKSTALRFVLKELENQFGYTIETKDIDLDILYSGGFTHTDVNIALQSVTIPLQLSYKIEDEKIIIFNYDQ
jgi:ferric-dicitrate binding protein FerR (iron transport regulator)